MTAHSDTQVIVHCKETNQQRRADVVRKTDTRLEVSFVGIKETVEMVRFDATKSYVGKKQGLEFWSTGKELF